MTRRIDTPEDLRLLMQAEHPVSDEQWPAVVGPLAPTVVIAGAGAGKTSLMKARVVYLVATGQVRPRRSWADLTTKAAAQLGQGVRGALDRAGLLPAPSGEEERLEPTVSTYNAYAAALLREHGLRIGHEPTPG